MFGGESEIDVDLLVIKSIEKWGRQEATGRQEISLSIYLIEPAVKDGSCDD